MAKVKQLLSLHHLFPRTHRLFPKTHRFFPKIADRTQTPFLFSLSPGHKHKPLFAYHKQAEKEDGNQERRSFSAISRIADHKDPDCRPPFTMAIGSTRFFSEDVTHFPDIKDPEILFVFKDLMAASWDELPDTLISDANKALSKNTDDKAAQEAVANVFRAAEAVGEFSGMLVSLRMAIDDSTGMGGEDVKPLPEEFVNALRTIYQRYTAYLDAFGPDETYLRKKVETELGTKMIHLKMRCSGIGSEWGKVTVLGTSGLSGSYVEHRA